MTTSDTQRTETTQSLKAEIAEELGLDPADVGDDADLIGLGLDSIRMMRLAGGWRRRGYDIDFARLSAEPVVSAWLRLLGAAGDAAPSVPDEAPPAPVDETVPFPLAPMQHAYWAGRTATAELGGVGAHLYVEFDGAGLDPERLTAAARSLVQAHSMLRARYLPDGTQLVEPAARRDPVTVVDLRQASAEDAERRLEQLRAEKSHQLLDIAAGEVYDLTLSLLPGGRHRLHFDIDMIAADAMSYRTLLRELVAAYDGAPLSPPGVTYAQYLNHCAAQPDPLLSAARDWWTRRLDDLPGGPVLPAPAVPPAGPARVQRMNHWLPPAAKDSLLAAAREHGVTPAAALAAVFAATVGAWSATPRFLLNVPLFQRRRVHPEIDRVSGDFSSSVLLDIDVTAPGTILDFAREVQRTMHVASAHGAYGALNVLRDLGRHRGEQVLAPVVFTSAMGLGELFAPEVAERLGDAGWIVSQGPQVVLDAQVTEVDGGLLTNWDVRIDQFADGVVEAMFGAYRAAVDRLADPAGWTAPALPELPAEQRAVRDRVNAVAAPSSGRLLHQEFFARAAREPERPALIWADGELSYAQLAERALRIASALRAAGVRPGDAVGVHLRKGYRQVIATLGVFAAGATWIPVAYDQPPARREAICRDGGIAVLLTDRDLPPEPESALPEPGAALPEPRRRVLTLDAALAHPPAAEPVLGDSEDVAYVLFTSGSTGTPKGVEVPHRAAMNTIDAVNAHFGVGRDDRSLTVAALEFDISVYDIFGLYSAGGAVVAVGADDAKDPARWRRLLLDHRATVLTCVPSALDMLLTAAEPDDGLGTRLKAVILGGDWVGVDLPGRLRAQAPQARFAGLGGATELAIHFSLCEVDGEPPAHWTAVPFGTPLANVRCRIVNAAGEDCPDWVAGELWVGGAGVAHGYRGDPERTATRFVTREGIRWYRTGDLARYHPDGTLEFLGRADHQVKIRGFRVELGEVEGALRAVDGVRNAVAAVLGTGGAERGTRLLAAAVDAEPGARLDADAVLSALADRLPSYMIPARLLVADELPLTPNGKLDRRAVTDLLNRAAGDSADTVAPRTDLERALTDLVGGVLGTPSGALGVTDDFFAAGLDSVLATTVIARIRELLDAPQAGIADMFAARTVADLAARLDAADARPGRLEEVAGVYLEIAALDEDEPGDESGGDESDAGEVRA
ncbi:amino acid adenylation domain-containing protein [Gordonia sp. (in: high G+C Gram-positive bacteria)]|uniref:non-ribosomal peptide synthetase n=1 Tax=Gordonia sp. (in: high G+C Gram-positive bacteria) TaxID=84139 RepID=UPI003528E447